MLDKKIKWFPAWKLKNKHNDGDHSQISMFLLRLPAYRQAGFCFSQVKGVEKKNLFLPFNAPSAILSLKFPH